MAATANVTVLLSTYNGAQYLPDQMKSLLAQDLDAVRIRVRDDGSSDETTSILASALTAGRIEYFQDKERLGSARSFMKLLAAPDDRSGFFAFCDQDDVWDTAKLRRAVSKLGQIPEDIPALYCSRLTYVDEQLRVIGASKPARKVGFGNALVENIAVGCTVVINRAARALIVSRMPDRVIMHDWWCYLVVACFGRVIFDEWSGILYRQHGNNSIGVARSPMDDFRRRLRRFISSEGGVFRASDQARTFLGVFGDMLPPHRRRLVESFLSAKHSTWSGIRLALSLQPWRQSWIDNAILKSLILMRRY